MAKKNHILPQHTIELDTEEKTIPTGAKYYLPTVKLNPVESALEEKDEEISSFIIDNYSIGLNTSSDKDVHVYNKNQTIDLNTENYEN